MPRCFTSELILRLCRVRVSLPEASGSKWCEEEGPSVFNFKNNSTAKFSSVCIFHAAVGCLQHNYNLLECWCLFFPLEIHKHHTGQQMQIIPEPPWLPWWVTAVSAETPLTTCVLLLCCRHLFSATSTHMWLMHVFFFLLSPLILPYPTTLVCCKQFSVQSCREITGMFQLLHTTFQQRFQVGSNLYNGCRLHRASEREHSSPDCLHFGYFIWEQSCCFAFAVYCFTWI